MFVLMLLHAWLQGDDETSNVKELAGNSNVSHGSTEDVLIENLVAHVNHPAAAAAAVSPHRLIEP